VLYTHRLFIQHIITELRTSVILGRENSLFYVGYSKAFFHVLYFCRTEKVEKFLSEDQEPAIIEGAEDA